MTMVSRKQSRRVFMCTECHKAFRSREELYMHAELCLLEAFEMEASQMLADMPALEEGAGILSEEPPPPPAPSQPRDDPPPPRLKEERAARDQAAREDPGNPAQDQMPGPLVEETAPRVPFARPRSSTRTIQTAAGLKLMVSVERPEDSGLRDEIASLDEGDLDEEELAALADEDVSVPDSNLSSPAKRPRGNHNVVIGALANGTEEDMYKPKMECPTCGLVLYRHNFSTHYRIHTGEMPFNCSYCEKRFRTTSALKVHVRAHTGEKPYVCPRCNYACITKRNLDRHIINNHVREGTRRGPRYRRSRYRLTDPHHEEYLISMTQDGQPDDPGDHSAHHHQQEMYAHEDGDLGPAFHAGQEEVSVEMVSGEGGEVEVVDEEVEVAASNSAAISPNRARMRPLPL